MYKKKEYNDWQYKFVKEIQCIHRLQKVNHTFSPSVLEVLVKLGKENTHHLKVTLITPNLNRKPTRCFPVDIYAFLFK